MADPGTRAADAAQKEMERRMRAIYRQAQKEIIEKLDKHTKHMNAMAKVKQAQVAAGEITQQEFDRWMTGQLFMTKQWKEKVDSVATTLLTANRQANAIVENKKRAVFGENALYQAYNLEHGISFSIYDRAAVTRLIKAEPELLPRRVVNGVKDKAWNRKKIANAVTEGIIQGESIPDIAQRIARETSSQNRKAMTRYARTAMTSAQNAGRIEAMHEAQEMGIKVKKKWMATLDNRTRDTHADLDGQVVDVDEPFVTKAGNRIMYPGDPSADPSEVYNCRCTMVYVYPEYPTPEGAMRRDNISGELISDMPYREWKSAKLSDENWFGVKINQVGETVPTEKYISMVTSRYDNAPEAAKAVYDKYIPEQGVVADAAYGEISRFKIKDKRIYMNYAKDARNEYGPGTTWFHEHGHYIDYQMGMISQNKTFLDLIKDDVNRFELGFAKSHKMRVDRPTKVREAIGDLLMENAESTYAIQDIFGGVLLAPYPHCEAFHDSKYWHEHGEYGVAGEAFAHMFEAMFDEKKTQVMREYMPNAWQYFETIIEGAAQ